MNEVVGTIETFLKSIGFLGPILCCFLIVIESIVPILPLAVFLTFNFLYFGPIVGFIISWLFTIMGCIISYILTEKNFKSWFAHKVTSHPKLNKFTNIFERLSFSGLVTIIAIPFTPAFLINISAGLTNVRFKKYFLATVLGKISLVLFWGYVGTSLIESFRNPLILIKVVIVIIVVYIISKFITRKYKLN